MIIDLCHARHAGTTRPELPGQAPDGAAHRPRIPGIMSVPATTDTDGRANSPKSHKSATFMWWA
jgi:hypothetical protein